MKDGVSSFSVLTCALVVGFCVDFCICPLPFALKEGASEANSLKLLHTSADSLSANKGVGLSLATNPPVIQSFEDLRISKAQELPTRTAQNPAIDSQQPVFRNYFPTKEEENQLSTQYAGKFHPQDSRLHPPPPVSQHELAALLHHHQSTQTRFRQAVTASPSGPLRLKANGRIQKPEVKNGGLVPTKQSPAATKTDLVGNRIPIKDFPSEMRKWQNQVEASLGVQPSEEQLKGLLVKQYLGHQASLKRSFKVALSIIDRDFATQHKSQPSTVAHTLTSLGNREKSVGSNARISP